MNTLKYILENDNRGTNIGPFVNCPVNLIYIDTF